MGGRSARRLHQIRGGPGIGEVAAAPGDPRAGALTVHRDRLQARQTGRIGALSMQHQAGLRGRQAPRHRGSDPGPAAGDDGDAHGCCSPMPAMW